MVEKVCVLGAGFIGKNLIERLLRDDMQLSVLDHKPMPKRHLNNAVKWIQGTYHDERCLEDALAGADVVFHLIGNTVPGDQVDLTQELSSNVTDSIRLLEACRHNGVQRVVFMSSAAVYGIQKEMPISESALTNPISTYGINKLAIEKYLHYYEHQFGLETRVIRLSNPYGTGQDIHGRQGFIAIALGSILGGHELMIRGDGSTVRDYIHIEDVIDACVLMMTDTGTESVFNIGSGTGVSLNAIVKMMEQFVGETIPVTYTGGRAVDIPVSVLDIKRAAAELHFHPKVSLLQGLERTMRELEII